MHGPVRWNSLPTSIRNTELSLNCFRRELQSFRFCWAYLQDQVRS